MKLNALLMVSD